MSKTYISPRVEVVSFELENILAGSPQLHNKYTDSEALTQRYQPWNSEEWTSTEGQ